jgi:flagellar biosynthesis component FlhA
MEARLDGKMMTAKVTEKWQELSEDKRRTVATLIVDTWVENSQSLRLLNSRDELEEVLIQRLPDEGTVARWTPATGLQLLEPQPAAKSES